MGRQRQDQEAAVSWAQDATVSSRTRGSGQKGSSNDKTPNGINLDNQQNLQDNLGQSAVCPGKKRQLP